jgi:ER-bound oxygenase mpaB/B'/Rubber oxygenase, catalytic domain
MKKFVWPWWAARRQVVVNSFPPHVRELFNLEWTPEDEEKSRRFMRMYRRFYVVLERLLPLKFLYLPIAVSGFEREGVDPRKITLESAQHRQQQMRRMGCLLPANKLPGPPVSPGPHCVLGVGAGGQAISLS